MLYSCRAHLRRTGSCGGFRRDDEIAVRNVRYEVTGELVRIYYDLVGPLDKVHKVALYLRRARRHSRSPIDLCI